MNKRQAWAVKRDDGKYFDFRCKYVSSICNAMVWPRKPITAPCSTPGYEAVPVVVTIREGRLR